MDSDGQSRTPWRAGSTIVAGARWWVCALPAVFGAGGFSANEFWMVARNFTVEMLRLVRPKNQIVDRVAHLIATN
jgi:hypothetical protein